MLALVATQALAVSVTADPQEQQARRLRSAVLKELERDRRFILVDRGAGINIALPARVGWERRLDWTEIHYQTRLNLADGRSTVTAGYCWNWNMSACARQILDAAAAFAGS